MVYDKASRELKAGELARLIFRRTMELAMVGTAAGGIAAVVGSADLAMRANQPTLLGIPIAIAAVLGMAFYLRWRSPPEQAVERIRRNVRSKRKAGDKPAALSRAFVLVAGGLALMFALLVAHLVRAGVL